MSITLETNRLYYRELQPTDDEAMFALDSNPEVHRYLGNKPVTTIEQSRDMIENIRQQYVNNGIGRMAAILKETDEFIGWVGLKLERNVNGRDQFYDIGYRLLQEHWGKGYATEANLFFRDYAFNNLKIQVLNATALTAHKASCRILEKTGLVFTEVFDYDGQECRWFEMINPAMPYEKE
ncbi:GNAT family N-acetyltransferase [Flavobacterium subsaxonicum]|uniref:GNAT family acetyltransferase n=1 Tax=Flavobacterium subsaxonicum WB 4.1-42 = DSM 21790 TaxID=1121898 RepID=A0A0A2MLR0_9FLAO|nr:GNAT family N-acetyltransferase [Flavobacterium subsaxonicum]KGO92428.1 GNAT family acetyltransferase [Flavobacterium subsaxonicum WB 4.1-42 = DSM 21790]